MIFSPIYVIACQNTWVILKCLCSRKIEIALPLEKRIKKEHWSVCGGKNDLIQCVLPKQFSNPGNSFLFKNGNEKCMEMILLSPIFGWLLLVSVCPPSPHPGWDLISQPKAGSNLVHTGPVLIISCASYCCFLNFHNKNQSYRSKKIG